MTFSNIPFIGLGFLVLGLAGFVGVAIALNEHPQLFAFIIGWYIVMIAFAAFALGKGAYRRQLFVRGRMAGDLKLRSDMVNPRADQSMRSAA